MEFLSDEGGRRPAAERFDNKPGEVRNLRKATIMSDALTEERRSDSKRIQFEFSADALERLERMKRLADKGTYAEVVRDSLRVYEWFLQQEKAGFDIGLVKDDALVKTIKFLL